MDNQQPFNLHSSLSIGVSVMLDALLSTECEDLLLYYYVVPRPNPPTSIIPLSQRSGQEDL